MFTYLGAFHPDVSYINKLKEYYQRGGLGDGTAKKVLEEYLQDMLRPIRERRAEFLSDKAQLIDVLKKRSQIYREKTESVLHTIKDIFGLNIF